MVEHTDLKKQMQLIVKLNNIKEACELKKQLSTLTRQTDGYFLYWLSLVEIEVKY